MDYGLGQGTKDSCRDLEDALNNQYKAMQRELELERKQLEHSKKEFELQYSFKKKCLEKQEELFSKRWEKLEMEVASLAAQRDQIARMKKEFVKQMEESQRRQPVVSAEFFFVGVDNELALKKRYKDLVKIYHPDNVSGDIYTIQEINREYDNLRKKLYAV